MPEHIYEFNIEQLDLVKEATELDEYGAVKRPLDRLQRTWGKLKEKH